MRLFSRLFLVTFICVFIIEVVALSSIPAERHLGDHKQLEAHQSLSFLQVFIEETEEIEEESKDFHLETDFQINYCTRCIFHSSGQKALAREFRREFDRYSRIVPLYKSIRSFLI